MNAKHPTVDDFEYGDRMSKSNLATLCRPLRKDEALITPAGIWGT
jgi:hypothetical protein